MPLLWEYGRHPVAPRVFNSGEYPQLVIDQDVLLGRETPLDVSEVLFLVDIDENVAVKCLEKPGPLEYWVATANYRWQGGWNGRSTAGDSSVRWPGKAWVIVRDRSRVVTCRVTTMGCEQYADVERVLMR